MQRIIGLVLKLQEPIDVSFIRAAPRIVVNHFLKICVSEDWRNMVQQGSQQSMRCVGVCTLITVIKLVDKSEQL